MATKLKLKDVRLSFPDLYVATEFKKGDGKWRYNASFLFEPGSSTDKEVKAAMLAEAIEAYGAKGAEKLATFQKGGNTAYSDGNDKEYDGYKGMMVLAAHRPKKDGPPGVFGNTIDPQTGKVVKLTEESGVVYAGCYVNGTVTFYTSKEFPGLWCGFSGVQFARPGDAFGGSVAASADDFDAQEGADAGDFA